jgi:hypothetical protein
MTRPRRIYQQGGNYYYIQGGAKKKIKVPEGISQRQLQKINIKNIINLAERRRVKRRKKPINVRYGKKIVSQMEKAPTPELPSLSTYLFKPKLAVKTLEQLAQSDVDTNVDKLANQLLARLQPVVTPPTVPLTMEVPTLPQSLGGVSTSTAPAPSGTAPAPVTLFPPEGDPPVTPQAQIRTGENRPAPASAPQAGTATPQTRSLAQRARDALGIRPITVAPAPPTAEEIRAEAQRAMPRNKYSIGREQNRPIVLESLNELIAEDPTITEISDANYESVKDRLMAKVSAKINRPVAEISRPNKTTLTTLLTESRTSARSSGRGHGEDDGLFNDEIEEIARRSIKNYVPVIASDEINTLSKYVKPGQKRFAFIINTNPSTSDGSGEDGHRPGHWRAVYINNDDDFPSVEYFDPLCEGRMPNDLLKVCMKIARKMNPEMMFKYKQNMLRRQSKLTSNCGYHSLAFIDDRYNGVPYADATGYTDYMEKLNEVKDDSRDGEKDVMKYIKKYESYI